MIGTVLDGRYHLVRLLGTGGMGVVYEALHVGTGRRVAVKVIANRDLATDPEIVVRFQREANAAGRLETRHIAQVLDASRDPATGLPFIVMEFLVGRDLKNTVEALGPLPPGLTLRIAAQACIGLKRAHEQHIVHRDIKPANLFLARQHDGEIVVKLLDFGIAKLPPELLPYTDGANFTLTGRLLGSPRFMSPEQAKGLKTLDHRTDIWSLGAVMYEALSGHAPFAEFETIGQLILALCSERPRDLQELAPWVPSDVARIVARAMRIDVDERYPHISEMLEDIGRLLPERWAIHEQDVAGVPHRVANEPSPPHPSTTLLGVGVSVSSSPPHSLDASEPLNRESDRCCKADPREPEASSATAALVEQTLASAGSDQNPRTLVSPPRDRGPDRSADRSVDSVTNDFSRSTEAVYAQPSSGQKPVSRVSRSAATTRIAILALMLGMMAGVVGALHFLNNRPPHRLPAVSTVAQGAPAGAEAFPPAVAMNSAAFVTEHRPGTKSSRFESSPDTASSAIESPPAPVTAASESPPLAAASAAAERPMNATVGGAAVATNHGNTLSRAPLPTATPPRTYRRPPTTRAAHTAFTTDAAPGQLPSTSASSTPPSRGSDYSTFDPNFDDTR